MFFSKGKAEFIRSRELAGDDRALDSFHTEIRRSYLSYKLKFPERELRDVFCLVPPHMAERFCGIARDAVGCEPVLLETKSVLAVRTTGSSSPESLFPFASAIGTALRAL